MGVEERLRVVNLAPRGRRAESVLGPMLMVPLCRSLSHYKPFALGPIGNQVINQNPPQIHLLQPFKRLQPPPYSLIRYLQGVGELDGGDDGGIGDDEGGEGGGGLDDGEEVPGEVEGWLVEE